jgi:putative FmdB family regulatory protein
MPRYEYRCRACGATFEVSRPMREATDPASCPDGHHDTVKLLSTVAVTGRPGPAGGRNRTEIGDGGGGGGCCGGSCGC